MTWPYQLPYAPNNPYLNTLNTFQTPLLFQNFDSNHLLQNFLQFPNQIPTLSHQYTPNHISNVGTFQTFPNFYFQCFKSQQKQPRLYHQQNSQKEPKQRNPASEQFNIQQNQNFDFNEIKKVKKQKNLISHNSSLRNDTKNIPKNYGKAMLSYIQKNTREVKELLLKHQVDFLQFMIFVKSFKSKINTIHDMRQMWGENEKENKMMKCIRILSYHFMRKKCLPYIFDSRIKNYHTHIKYRKKIMQGIQNPQNFTKIKQF